MFFERRCFCVLCGKYKSTEKLQLSHKGIAVCKSCYDNIGTTKDKSFDGKGNIKIVLSPYVYGGAIREAVKVYKFSGQWLYGELFGRMICDELKEHTWLLEYDCIIPVPLHESRFKERGYNQSEILARVMSEHTGIPMLSDVLFRIRETKRQSTLKGLERIENVRNAFWAHPEAVRNKRIILVDDIYTMGETAGSCAQALKAAGAADIAVITLCITVDNKYYK
ncbi:MAG: ComF family protein [Clostridia bacterium]|nr:ComF family protein [Clostridia bacterium]